MDVPFLITADTAIDELVEKLPESVQFLSENGIRCIICGEPIWGTLESAAKEKGYDDVQIHAFVKELNKLAEER